MMRTASDCTRTGTFLASVVLWLTPFRVYYLPVKTMHLATSIARPNLISMGTCFGKFSKGGKFKLGITSLDWLAKYAKYKVGLTRATAARSVCSLVTLRSGSSRLESCRFCTVTTSSRHTLVGSPKIRPSTRVS